MTSTTACLPKQSSVTPTTNLSSDTGAEALYQEAKAAQRASDVLTAKARFKQIVDQHKTSVRRADALAELGEIFFRENGCKAGLVYFQALVTDFPDHPHVTPAKQKLNQCESANAGKSFDSAEDPAERLAIAQTAARQAIAVSDYSGAVRWLTTALSASSDEVAKAKLKEQIVEIIDSKVSAQEVRTLFEEY